MPLAVRAVQGANQDVGVLLEHPDLGDKAAGEAPCSLIQAQRRRRDGWIFGKKPLTVPSLISAMARARSNFLL